MKVHAQILTVMLAGLSFASAQTVQLKASHARTNVLTATSAVPNKPVARVNGAVLTEIDVRRMMVSMFPYARQHNGVPKAMETEVRKGALEMVIFEELLYQEAKRRNLVIDADRLNKAQVAFRKRFADKSAYEEFLRTECKGSKQVLRDKIQRSLLIEKMVETEVDQRSSVTPAAAKSYYDNNVKRFEHGETVSFQTISIIPAANATEAMKREAKAKITDIVRLGRGAKTARDFGYIAEQVSEDDWRTKMGDRGTVEVNALPPEVVKAVRAMKVGEVSEAIQLGTAWVVIRLNAHTPAGKTPFAQVKSKLLSDLKKQKRQTILTALNQKLHKSAKIEVL